MECSAHSLLATAKNHLHRSNNTNVVLPVFHVQEVIVIILYRYNDCVRCLRAWHPKNKNKIKKSFVKVGYCKNTSYKKTGTSKMYAV